MSDDGVDFFVISAEEYDESLRGALYDLGMTPKEFLSHVADCGCCFDGVSPEMEDRMDHIWFVFQEKIREWAA